MTSRRDISSRSMPPTMPSTMLAVFIVCSFDVGIFYTIIQYAQIWPQDRHSNLSALKFYAYMHVQLRAVSCKVFIVIRKLYQKA